MTSTEERGPSSRLNAAALVVAIVALALANRLLGIDGLLPCAKEPDTYVAKQVRYLRDPAALTVGEGKKALRKYPWVTARVTALLPDPLPELEALEPDDLEAHLRAASADLLQLRIVVAWLSVLLVPGTYFVARAFVSWPWAACAAWLAATSLVAVNYAQQARPHAVSAGFAALAVASALRLRRRPSLAAYAGAAACTALAAGSLQFGAAAAGSLVAAHLLRERAHGGWRGVSVAAAVLALGIVVFYPFAFDGSGTAGVTVEGGMLRIGSHPIQTERFGGRGFARMAGHFWSYDPVLVVLAAAGLVAASFAAVRAGGAGCRRDALVVAAHGLPLFVALGVYSVTPARFVLPLVPHLAVLAALGLRALARAVAPVERRSRLRAALLGGVLVVSLGLPAATAWRLAWLRSRPDTLDLAADWLRANTDHRSDRIAVRAGSWLPMFEDPGRSTRPASSRYSSPWGEHLRSLAARGISFGPAWSVAAVHERSAGRDGFRVPREVDEAERMLDELGASYLVTRTEESARRASPLVGAAHRRGRKVFGVDGGEGAATGRGYQAFRGSLSRLVWNAQTWGTGVNVYRLAGTRAKRGR